MINPEASQESTELSKGDVEGINRTKPVSGRVKGVLDLLTEPNAESPQDLDAEKSIDSNVSKFQGSIRGARRNLTLAVVSGIATLAAMLGTVDQAKAQYLENPGDGYYGEIQLEDGSRIMVPLEKPTRRQMNEAWRNEEIRIQRQNRPTGIGTIEADQNLVESLKLIHQYGMV